MKTAPVEFNSIVELVYNLPIEYKEELINLLEHNLVEARREEISKNYNSSRTEQKAGHLKFSSSVKDLKKMV